LGREEAQKTKALMYEGSGQKEKSAAGQGSTIQLKEQKRY